MNSLWITNFSKKAVAIADLGISLQPKQSMDLMRSKILTKEEIKQSYLYGDLKKAKTKLSVSNHKLEMTPPELKEFKKVFPGRSVSAVKIEYKKFSELEELMTGDNFDSLSEADKIKLESQIIAKKEEEIISKMLEE